MKVELTDVSATRKELKIEIPAEAVRAAFDRISDRYAKLAAVPGFRKGRAPVSVVRTRFRDEIRGEVLQEIVPQAVSEAITEKGLNVIGEPDLHLDNPEGLNNFGTEPIGLHAHVEVMPEVALGEYKNLEAARRTRPVTDEDVERVIEGLRESSASLQPVEDRGAQIGDTVTATFNGKFTETPDAEDINVENVDVELGGEGVQQEFTDSLLDARADEERPFTVKYPDDFSSKGLAGKTVNYTAKVTAVRRKEVPEADDEWAKSLGEEFESVATLREKIREDLTQRSRFESDSAVREDVLRKLIEAHPFEVPQSFVDHQTSQRLEQVARDMMRRGIDPRTQQLDWENVRESLSEQAAADVRGAMLLEEIAERENIEVSDEEIEAEISQIAAASRQPVEQVHAALTKQGGERSIADRLRNRKALDLIVENARVTDEEWRDETALENEAATTQEEVANETPDAEHEEKANDAKA
ncbi:MAG: trigger factor [Pyrinomonadaceae bacterium]